MKPIQHDTIGSSKKEIPYFKGKLKALGAAAIAFSKPKPKYEITEVLQAEDLHGSLTEVEQELEGLYGWEKELIEGIGKHYPDNISGTLTGDVEILPATITHAVIPEKGQEVEEGEFEINAWVIKHLSISESGIASHADATAEGHEEEVVQFLCDYVDKHDVPVYWWNFRLMLGKVSVETLRTAVCHGALHQLYGVELPRGFTLDQACIDETIATDQAGYIFDYIDLLDESVPLQSVVDTFSASQSAYVVVVKSFNLPEDVTIPVACVESAVKRGYEHLIVDLIESGRLQNIEKGVLRKILLKSPEAQWVAFRTGLMSDISRDEMIAYIEDGTMEVNDVFRHMQQQGVSLDDALIHDLVDRYTERVRASYICTLSSSLQSKVFDYYCKEAPGTLELILAQFNNLSEEQYRLVIERYSETLKTYDSYEIVAQIFSHASESIKDQISSDIHPAYKEREEAKSRLAEENKQRRERRKYEEEYFTNASFSIDTHSYDADISEADIVAGFENEHCVKRAAELAQQATDTGRESEIVYVTGQANSVATMGDNANYEQNRALLTEHEAIGQFVATMERLKQLANDADEQEDTFAISNIMENITFIGEPEYEEATKGIAIYWKHLLNTNPELQLLVLKGAISSGYSIKSDEYMFDRILAHFSNEDFAKYRGRLIVDAKDIGNVEPQNIRTILLDDWTISGCQLRTAATDFISAQPHLHRTVEIHLIAAAKERIALGLEQINTYTEQPQLRLEELPILIRAYYEAHNASDLTDSDIHGGIITGAHSSVDFGFEYDIATLCSRYGVPMPPLTNIVRPYRLKGYKRRNLKRYYKMTEQEE